MQQTEKYKLNLVEKTDTFSPDPLNENMEKVEGALEGEAAARAAADAALDQRVTVLEAHKVLVGSYAGNDSGPRTISLGVTPKLVLLRGATVGLLMAIPGHGDFTNSSSLRLGVVDGGFLVSYSSNDSGKYYCYLAIV